MAVVDRALSGGSTAVLVALPDGDRAAAISRALAAEHLMPVMAFTCDTLVDFAADRAVSAVVVDPSMDGDDPVGPGPTLIRRVRTVTAAPIVLLGFVPGDGWSTTGEAIDGLLGADASAADVVGSVLTAMARRGSGEEVVACADLVIDVRNYEAWQGTRRLSLTPTELRVLAVLVAAHGDVVTKRDLQKAAWGSAGTHDDNRLQAHVRRLRSKLVDPVGAAAGRLRTVRGVGFRLEPPGAATPGLGDPPPGRVGVPPRVW